MEEKEVVHELNASLRDAVSRKHGYTAVYALLIHWAEADDGKIAEEVNAVRELFEERFGFIVSKYPIPSDRPGPNLQSTLTSLVLGCKAASDCLLVVYYAGHG